MFHSNIVVDTYQYALLAPDGRFVAVVVDPLTAEHGVFLIPIILTRTTVRRGDEPDGFLRERYPSFLERLEAIRTGSAGRRCRS